MIAVLTNHLWQSTAFALAAGLLTLAFRWNRAQVRYWLWLIASIKFLVPFSLLMNIGSGLEWAPGSAVLASPAVSVAVERIAQPFRTSAPVKYDPARSNETDWTTVVIVGVWLCGFLTLVASRGRNWLRIHAAVKSGTLLELGLPVEARSCSGLMEPSVAGWLKPVLLLPAGIRERLTAPQFEAVLAHELFHVKRRDNLTAAIHMANEALFWFHPLVWWIGGRLIEERERACDEEVLRQTGQPLAYAEGILNVCKLYIESRMMCVPGVTGADLKKRIEEILANRVALKLNPARRLLLVVAGMIAACGPFTLGVLKGQDEPRLEFDVASVKQHPIPVGFVRRGWTAGIKCPGIGQCGLTGNRFTELQASLTDLIMDSYRVRRYQIAGLPDWGDTGHDVYDVFATVEGQRNPTLDQARRMLQTLLADRFGLKVHRETRTLPVYALVVPKRGLKLKHDKPEEGEDVEAFVRAWERVEEVLSMVLDRPVIDLTGFEGVYKTLDGQDPISVLDFGETLRMRGSKAPAASSGASIFTEVREKWGLRLEPQKAPVEVIVIDHVQRPGGN